MTPSAAAPVAPAPARAYLRLLVAGFRQQSAYLAAAVGGLVANATFGFLKAAILLATLAAAGGTLGGYDTRTMLAYVWLSQAMLGLVNVYGRDVLAERIRSGDIAVDFLRPLDLQLAGLATFLGSRLFTLLPRGLPTLTVGLLTTGMALPRGVWPYLLGTLSVLLAMTLSYLCVYALSMSALWLVEIRGLQVAYMVVASFCCGLYIPVGLFPGWLETLARITPFPSTLMTPVEILSGYAAGTDALRLVAVQVLWISVVAAGGHLLTRAGRRHLEVQGG